MPYFQSHDGTEIYYRDWGSGKPVVLIHGWPLTSDMWEWQSTHLAEAGFRVITYDRRGFGRSGQPWGGYDYDSLALDLHTLVDRLDLRQAALVGFSMGGGEVARYLSRRGAERVDRAVLIAAVTPLLVRTGDNSDGIDPQQFADIARQLRVDRPKFLGEFARKFYGRTLLTDAVSDEVLQWTLGMAMTASLRATLAAAQSWSTTDFRPDLDQIDVPVRVIHGTSDETVPIEISGRRTANLLRNGTLSEYDGQPHGLFATATGELNAELVRFLEGTR